jgi:hypothetical protein
VLASRPRTPGKLPRERIGRNHDRATGKAECPGACHAFNLWRRDAYRQRQRASIFRGRGIHEKQ